MSYIIDRLDDFGRGITNVDGKTCFVSLALDNEEVNINITKDSSKYMEGVALDIIKRSKDRVEPSCNYYPECGGCNIMHMNYQKQLDFKSNKVKNVLFKFAKISNVVKEIIPSKEFTYRNKVTLKVVNGRLGYYRDNTHNLIEISKCLLLSDSINDVIIKLKELDLSNLEEVIIRSNYLNEILLCLKGKDIDEDYFINNLNDVTNIVLKDSNELRVIKGNSFFIDVIQDMYYKVSIDSFFQVNSYNVKNLYNKVLDYADLKGNEKVLDLYCGTGTIGMFLAKKAKYVYGIEINKSAVEDAKYNKKLNDIDNIDFLCSDVGKIKEDYKDIDLVVLDPPRAGLSKDAINNVIDINPNKIIYVSCDSITLARDLNIFKNKYNIKEITLVDMFPNTYHVECVCLLMKKKS